MKVRQRNISPRTLARLDRERRRHGITLAIIATEAAKTARFGSMTVATVSRALSGSTKSANVVETVKRLIEEATQNGTPERLRA